MEGRFPHGVRLVLTNCIDPSREGEFNRWYDQVHLPDILGAGSPPRAFGIRTQTRNRERRRTLPSTRSNGRTWTASIKSLPLSRSV